MITKIEKLKNIGNFEDYIASGDVTLKQFSIVYADNGAGKTTLARVFHSLSMNDPDVVLRHKRINGTGNPEITIKNESASPYVFNGCFAGGFVGFLSASKLEAHVSNSVNSGAVMTSSNAIWEKYDKFSETCGPSCAGGFFGFLDEDESTSYFHNCLNKGSIEAYSEYTYARAGGFIGYSRENNNVSQGDQSGSKDHVYAAMCVNTGSIVGHTDNKGSFCGTINGMKCVNCMWLDEHNYGDGVRAALPYRPKLDDQAGGNYDTVHDVYYYKTIDTSTIAAAFKKMTDAKTDGGRACRYDDDKFQLRWGTLDEWKEWAVAWKGQAVWNGSNTLDLDFTVLWTLR